MNYETLESEIVRWAAAEQMVRALVVIGSRAREDHKADALSDLDLVLFVNDPQVYVQNTSWLDAFGDVWLRVLNSTGAGDPEWLLLFAGGLKVDFILVTATGRLSDMLFGSFYKVAAWRGVRVLLDKDGDGLLRAPMYASDLEWVQPDPEEFSTRLQQFWLSCYRASNMMQRGELWRAKAIIDGPMRNHILCMVEWHAKAQYGTKYDTWYDGRFLDEWVGEKLLLRLPLIFASMDDVSSRRAISASLLLVDELGQQTAAIWGYPYPIKNQTLIQEWIEASLSAG